ncbi:hypothetical protein VP501E541_P0153 [Vibrio phage 501E54-1]|nr:hypothetical protein VP501E541_P0153 [Vibrio phage 501E54-1]
MAYRASDKTPCFMSHYKLLKIISLRKPTAYKSPVI